VISVVDRKKQEISQDSLKFGGKVNESESKVIGEMGLKYGRK
jgi:hypothetical protein